MPIGGTMLMVFPPNFPVDIFITKDLFKKGMQAIHTEMKKHETFQQNMYNRLHNELQTFIKGKSPTAFTHVPESAPVRPPVSAEPSTDDLKSMLMARLLAEGDNTEADLVHALRRNTELHTVSLANQVTKSDL